MKKSAPIATVGATSADEKKICKTVPVMGSNLPKRVCSTAAEWAAYKKQGQETVDDFERARDAAGTPTNGAN